MPGEQLRILLLIRNMALGGGAESLVFNTYQELKKREGVKVKLIAFQAAPDANGTNAVFFEEQLKDDPDFHYCSSYVRLSVLKKNEADLKSYCEIVETFRPHIIHSHLFTAEIISREVLFKGVKYFTHTHDNMKQFRNFSFNTLLNKELLTNYYEKIHLIAKYKQCNNRFISISEDTTAYFKQVLPKTLSRNIYPLDNAIVTETFAKINTKRSLDKIRIVNVGSFQAKKNQKFLIETGAELLRRGLDFEITLLGGGGLYNEVKDLVKRNNLESRVNMPGNVANTAVYYSAANLYIHTATYEPFGLVLLEAMASGLPVIALNGRGNRQLIEDGHNGFMLDEQNATKFADIIQKVVSDEKLYNTLSANAVKFARKYDIVAYVDKLLAIYNQAG
ncbi:MAG TPA: glycosyltransferase family 4 protein [Chitinophagales bacterium]|nr:glycosyltransferase family 4 protein [Chitinophagales bacterium]